MMERNDLQAHPGDRDREPERAAEGEPERTAAPVWLLALAGMMLVMFFANGIMVWFSLSGHRDLVRPDYYDAGLDQDATMARAALSRRPGMEADFIRGASGWAAETASDALKEATCRVLLYRPDNRREDRVLEWGTPLASPVHPERVFWKGPVPALRRGQWEARLVWEVDGKAVMEKPYRFRVPE